MEKYLLAVISLLAIGSYLILKDQNIQTESKFEPNKTALYDSFVHWKQKHSKVFGEEENDKKFQVYTQNFKIVMEHNEKADEKTMHLELNKFSDLTSQEFKEMYHGYVHIPSYNQEKVLPDDQIPKSFDWREKGAVTKVKNQQQCGSCWAFSTTGALEGLYFIKYGQLKEFSEQQLVDCSTEYGNEGCNGGLMDNAFQYVKEKGITTEDSYPYQGFSQKCKSTDQASNFKVSGFFDVPKNSNKQLLLAIQKGPVSIAIDAEGSFFQLYKKGIYDQPCADNLDHGVLVVGFGEEDGKKFYIIKNSWGPDWGENGYIRLLRNDNDDEGLCGIRMSASYPEDITTLAIQ